MQFSRYADCDESLRQIHDLRCHRRSSETGHGSELRKCSRCNGCMYRQIGHQCICRAAPAIRDTTGRSVHRYWPNVTTPAATCFQRSPSASCIVSSLGAYTGCIFSSLGAYYLCAALEQCNDVCCLLPRFHGAHFLKSRTCFRTRQDIIAPVQTESQMRQAAAGAAWEQEPHSLPAAQIYYGLSSARIQLPSNHYLLAINHRTVLP